jgi:hypothetical protein
MAHMRINVLLIVFASALAGCAAQGPREVALPEDRQQPRVAELLVYLEYRGVPDAARSPVFEMSHWIMYDDASWDQNPRKPRLEGAQIVHKGMKIIVAVSPVKTAVNEDKLVRTEKERDGKKSVVGATLLPAGKRWSVGFTMAEPNEKLQTEMEDYIAGFARQFTHRRPAVQAIR